MIFGSHIGEGDNKQRLHGTALQAEERKEKQNHISVSKSLDVDALTRYKAKLALLCLCISLFAQISCYIQVIHT